LIMTLELAAPTNTPRAVKRLREGGHPDETRFRSFVADPDGSASATVILGGGEMPFDADTMAYVYGATAGEESRAYFDYLRYGPKGRATRLEGPRCLDPATQGGPSGDRRDEGQHGHVLAARNAAWS
jgi:hypothetical protein